MRTQFALLLKSLMLVCLLALCGAAAAQETPAPAPKVEEVAAPKSPKPATAYWAIAICMAVGSLSAAYAVGKIGAAAMGAAAEKPEVLGKAIPFVGLGEGIALFGFLIALFIILN